MQFSSATLYDKDECPFCWKVRLALWFKNIAVRHITIDTDNKPAEFTALSATGKVPLLAVGGELISESTAICRLLEDHAPQPALFGRGAEQSALISELNAYSDSVIGPAIRDAIFTQRGRPPEQWDRAAIARSEQQWGECLLWLEQQLAARGAGAYSFAGDLSLAECALLPRFGLAAAYGLRQVEQFPALRRWFEHHRQQPYYAATAPTVARQLPL